MVTHQEVSMYKQGKKCKKVEDRIKKVKDRERTNTEETCDAFPVGKPSVTSLPKT